MLLFLLSAAPAQTEMSCTPSHTSSLTALAPRNFFMLFQLVSSWPSTSRTPCRSVSRVWSEYWSVDTQSQRLTAPVAATIPHLKHITDSVRRHLERTDFVNVLLLDLTHGLAGLVDQGLHILQLCLHSSTATLNTGAIASS